MTNTLDISAAKEKFLAESAPGAEILHSEISKMFQTDFMNSAFADELVQNTHLDQPFSVSRTITVPTKDIPLLTRVGLESNPDFQKFEEQLGFSYDLEIDSIENCNLKTEHQVGSEMEEYLEPFAAAVIGAAAAGMMTGSGNIALATGAISGLATLFAMRHTEVSPQSRINIDFKITANEHVGADLTKYVGENAVYLKRYDNGFKGIEDVLGKAESDFDLSALSTETQRALLYLSQEDYSEDIRPLKTLSHQIMHLKHDVTEFINTGILEDENGLLAEQVQSNIDLIAKTLKDVNDSYVDVVRERVAGNLSVSADVQEFVANELKHGMKAESFKLSSADITSSMVNGTPETIKLEVA